ncbi:hypothetical protein J6590_000521 [Homalodisca vitripennis]|nr:hypothetical protein J6590_000521 [Homalodisca vitripennis]
MRRICYEIYSLHEARKPIQVKNKTQIPPDNFSNYNICLLEIVIIQGQEKGGDEYRKQGRKTLFLTLVMKCDMKVNES